MVFAASRCGAIGASVVPVRVEPMLADGLLQNHDVLASRDINGGQPAQSKESGNPANLLPPSSPAARQDKERSPRRARPYAPHHRVNKPLGLQFHAVGQRQIEQSMWTGR